MIFSPSRPRPVREFSLAELVAKISELEQRQRNRLRMADDVAGTDEAPVRQRHSVPGAGEEAELTE